MDTRDDHARASEATSFVYIVPVHNEERTLAAHVDKIFARFAGRPDAVRVVLAENGSRDRSAEVAREIARAYGADRVLAESTPLAGLGHGLALGLSAAFARDARPSSRRFYVLTAADLPFGFSDVEAFESALRARPELELAVGSKAHAQSRVPGANGRAVFSFAYRLARRAILGMRTADSQGSIFVRDPLARALLPEIAARDFFFSTELVYHAERRGMQVIELPVELQRAVRRSTVKPLRDGALMLRQLIALRQRSGAR
jgi:hypothetical protein